MRIPALLLSLLATVAVGGCGSSTAGEDSDSSGEPTLSISAIPDQDPEPLARLYPVVAQELSQKLGVPVRYRPVTDYAASVTAFKTGGLDAVWFGGLTGVQAEAQVPGARPLAQRDIDADFHSVFIASRRSDIAPIRDVVGLSVRQDTRFTFGSESSTSGRLMPEYFLGQAGIEEEDFRGALGFSGSHDKTIALVASGTYDAGVLNEQVWNQRVEEGAVDASKVKVVFRTPAYHDYYWLARPDLDERFGDGFTDRLRQALLDMRDPKVLELFGAERFIPVRPDDHDETRQVAERLGLLDEGGVSPGPTGAPAFAAEAVSMHFGARRAVDEVDLVVRRGERVALVGPSGAGKSTLLRLLGGSIRPTSGSVRAFGADLMRTGSRARRQVQREIGAVHQQLDLVGPLSVVHNVNAGQLGRWPLWRAAASLVAPGDAPEAAAALRRVGLAGREREQTARLSGGEQQRVAIARLLVQSPAAALADEPVASLDPTRSREMLDLLFGLDGATLVVALHDVDVALERFERVVALRAGRVEFDLPSAQVEPARLEALYALERR